MNPTITNHKMLYFAAIIIKGIMLNEIGHTQKDMTYMNLILIGI